MADSRRTLLFLVKDNQILLAMKKRGFGAGRWNGVGGKLELGESLDEAVIRECQEEIGVTPTSYRAVAELDFYGGADTDQWHMYVYAYLCEGWEGEPIESEEMAPQWFDIDKIPYKDMWQDDEYWLPRVLTGELVTGVFTFDENDNLTDAKLEEVSEL